MRKFKIAPRCGIYLHGFRADMAFWRLQQRQGWQKERSIYISPAESHLFLRFMAGYLIVGLTGLPFISLN